MTDWNKAHAELCAKHGELTGKYAVALRQLAAANRLLREVEVGMMGKSPFRSRIQDYLAACSGQAPARTDRERACPACARGNGGLFDESTMAHVGCSLARREAAK